MGNACTTKAGADGNRSLARRLQLEYLSMKELRACAKEFGASSAQLEDAAESDTPKDALIALVMELNPPDVDGAAVDLRRSELESLSMRELRACAKEAGASAAQLEDAADSDTPKAMLVTLVVELAPPVGGRGAAEARLLRLLQAGGQPAADAVVAVLTHAIDTLDSLATSTPRQSRKPLLALLERAEAAVGAVDARWGDQAATLREGQLVAVSVLLAKAERALEATPGTADQVASSPGRVCHQVPISI